MQKFILLYFLFINIASFVFFTFDKYRSRVNGRRVAEKKLHLLSLLGGFLGASLSMAMFQHKVSKTSFLLIHILIIVLWIAGTVYYFTQLNELNFLR